MLETAPYGGRPLNPDRGNFRSITFGPRHEGLILYFVLEYAREVDIVRITWAG